MTLSILVVLINSFQNLKEATCVVYGMGSLYTSLCPSLVLEGIGETIAGLGNRAQKVSQVSWWPENTNHLAFCLFLCVV